MTKMLKTKLSGLWLHPSVCMYVHLQRILLELICKELCLIGLKELNAYIKVLKIENYPNAFSGLRDLKIYLILKPA